MNRKTSTLLSLGISIALIACTIWFLFNHHDSFGYSSGRWAMPHHMTIGGETGFIMIIFWVALISRCDDYIGNGSRSAATRKRRRQGSARCLGNIEKPLCPG